MSQRFLRVSLPPVVMVVLALLLSACRGDTVITPPLAEQCEVGLEQTSTRPPVPFSPVPINFGSLRDLGPHAPNEVLVRYREAITPLGAEAQREHYQKTASAVTAAYALAPLQVGETGRPDLLELTGNDDLVTVLQKLNDDPRVLYAEPNYYLKTLAEPNDPLLNRQWNLLDFGVPEAWDIETGRDCVVIAVIDSGVDTRHEDLRDKLLPGIDLCSRFEAPPGEDRARCLGVDTDPNPGPPNRGDSEHGTHVAGIAAASGNNGVGIAGVAYHGVKILPVKVFNDAGKGATVSELLDGIRWAVGEKVNGAPTNENRAHILNLSLGVNSQAAATINAIRDVVGQVKRDDLLIVAAAGNNSSNISISAPASDPDVLAVGSVNSTYRRSSFSDYDNTGNTTVDIMAPGGNGPSICGLITSTFPNDNYQCLQGTSMAAPFVAGVAALIWSQDPTLTAEQVTARLKESALFDRTFMTEEEYGSGIVCADRALGAATQCGR